MAPIPGPRTASTTPCRDPRTGTAQQNCTHTHECTCSKCAQATSVTRFTPAHKESPQDIPLPPQPPMLAKTKPRLAPSPPSPPCWRRACPTCPSLLGRGPTCSRDQLPAQHRAGCPELQHVASPTPSSASYLSIWPGPDGAGPCQQASGGRGNRSLTAGLGA